MGTNKSFSVEILAYLKNKQRKTSKLLGKSFYTCFGKTFRIFPRTSREQLIRKQFLTKSLREKCPFSEILWFVFFRIWTKYGEIRTRKTPNGHFSGSQSLPVFTRFLFQQKHLSREVLKEATVKYLSKVLGEKLLLKLVSRIANVQLTILTRKDSVVVNFLKHAFSLVS